MKNLPVDRIIPEEYRCKNKFCEIFSHYLNPFGNWMEPLPYPEKRRKQAEEQWLPPIIWWQIFRNPLHNFTHFWIGITPLGPRYCWILPESAGWIRTSDFTSGQWKRSYWTKENSRIKLPFWDYNGDTWQFYIGWLSRGNFGIALRKNEKT